MPRSLSGCSAPPATRLPRRPGPSHCPTEPAAFPGPPREPPGPVRDPGSTGPQAIAPGRLRICRMAPCQTRYRLPRGGGQALLQCPPCPGGKTPGAAHHRRHRRGDAQGQAGGVPSPARLGTLLHTDRTHAQVPPGAPGVVPGPLPELGCRHRPLYRPGGQAAIEDRPHPEHGYRACLGLLNLAKRYDRTRLEAACERALMIRSARYVSAKQSALLHFFDRRVPG